ncbi:O-methyltransferase [Salinispira pacifica]
MKTPITEELHRYVLENSIREHPVLTRIREETARMPEYDMQIPPLQGQLMSLLASLIGAERILEIGTFTGYSSTAMALVLPPNGRVTCCDRSERYTDLAKRYWKEAGVESKMELLIGDALELTGRLISEGREGSYDAAFIDADKEAYDSYYENCLRLVRRGGIIMLDNMLWAGAVIDEGARDADTTAIRRMNRKIHEDARVDAVLLPIGDGLTVARVR